MLVHEFEVSPEKLQPAARQVLDRATEEARRRCHGAVTGEHLALAFAQIDWDQFAQMMRNGGANPQMVFSALEERVQTLRPMNQQAEWFVSPSAKLAVRLAVHNAGRAGRATVDGVDLFVALLEQRDGAVGAVLRRFGVDPEVLASRVVERARDIELREEWLRKQFELPPMLRFFGTNLNLLARQDKLPPVFARDHEIAQVLEILCHRERANSVMLVGEAGVGKTAVVEGIARRIEFEPDRVPIRLRGCQIVNLQMNAMVAGTQLRGMFEERLDHVIKELKEHANLILFVDEAHTMVGAGSALGAPSDAANIFKSVLARGEIRMIAATTLGEYKQSIQEDEALARRYRCVHVNEPTLAETRTILQSLRPRMERNYSVHILDAALDAVVDLAPRYMRHLHLPDKAIGWLDTAAVRAEIGRRPDVDREDVVSVISDAAQIPMDMVFRDVSSRFSSLEARLQERVIGQSEAVAAVARRLVLNKGPLKDGFDRPDGVLLFLGPTGVGKTELAKAVAEFLFGDEKKMVRIDMSEYQDGQVATEKLIGMPRGIVGSERGGALTTRLKDTPFTVVLLDEIEKATPSVLNVFLQAFDEGWLTDGRGHRVYLSDAIVIMTSNLGSEHFRKLTSSVGFVSREVGIEQVRSDVFRELERRFSPEFRNRIDEVVLFSPLGHGEVRQIARRYFATIERTLQASGKGLEVAGDAFDAIVNRGYSLQYGARFLKRVIDDTVKLPISVRWHEGSRFRVVLRDAQVVVEAVSDGFPLESDVGEMSDDASITLQAG